MIIALASPRVATSVDEGLHHVEHSIRDAAAQGAQIVCFPEAYLPGLRGLDFDVPPFDQSQQEWAIRAASQWSRAHKIATILGTERTTTSGRQIVAVVIGADGDVKGYQAKNQLDPAEEPLYVPGEVRQLFDLNGVTFGIAICHEGFRYPETVRWAAVRGAKVVFHPHCTGSDRSGPTLTQWCAPDAPYFEKAMMCRALENEIFFASVNYGFRYQESATSVIGPSGALVAQLPYGQPGVLVQQIEPSAATGLLAARYAPQRYREPVGP